MPKDYVEPQLGTCFAELLENPIGSGPFKYLDHQLGVKYEFERFDDYYHHPGNGYEEDRRAKFQFLDLQIVLEGVTRAAALQAGDADLIEGNIQILDQLEKIDGGQVVWQDESAHRWVINVDCWQPDLWCYKKDARQAKQ